MSIAETNNVLTSEERRTWVQSVAAGGSFVTSAVKNVMHGGKRSFKPLNDPSLPQPIFNGKPYAMCAWPCAQKEVSSPPLSDASSSLPSPPQSDTSASPTCTSPLSATNNISENDIKEEIPPSREQCFAQLLSANRPETALDVLIIGGGVTGTGIALDLAARGVKAAEEKRKYKYISKKEQQQQQQQQQDYEGTLCPKSLGLTTLSIGLVEANDYASETSSRSSKLIHGGVRYLEKAVFGLDYQQLKLVFEALSERANVVHQAPFLVHPIETIIPCYSFYDLAMFWTGMKMYDLLAVIGGGVVGGYSSFHNRESTQRLYSHLLPSKQQTDSPSSSTASSSTQSPSGTSCDAFGVCLFSCAKRIVSKLVGLFMAIFKWITVFPACLIGSVCYYDGQHHDSRVCLHVAMTAARYGAACVNHCKLEGIQTIPTEDSSTAAVLNKCTIVDRLTNTTHTIYAKSIVNATGPFSDSVRSIVDAKHKNKVKPSHGTHITLPSRFAPRDRAMLIPSSDGRVIFCISYLGHCIAGTTDAISAVEESPQAPEKDVEFILENLRAHLGPIERYDVLSVWCGIRPLAAPEAASDGASSQSIVREHSIHVDVAKRVLSITGGKWTTYRKMAADAVDALVEKGLIDGDKINHESTGKLKGSLITADLVLHGARKLQALIEREEENEKKTKNNTTFFNALASHPPSHFAKPYWVAATAISERYNSQIPRKYILHWLMTYGDGVEKICEIAAEVMKKDGHTVFPSFSSTPLASTAAAATTKVGIEDASPSLSKEEADNYWKTSRLLCCSVETPILATDVDVVYSARYEYCERVQDFICRRAAIAFLNEGVARSCIEKVAESMGAEKGWTAERLAFEKADAHEYLKSFVAKA